MYKLICAPNCYLEVENILTNFGNIADLKIIFGIKDDIVFDKTLFDSNYEFVSFSKEIQSNEIILALLKDLYGEEDVIIIRNTSLQNWDFVKKMIESHQDGNKIVWVSPKNPSKIQTFVDNCANLFAKKFLGIDLFKGSIIVSLFDNKILKIISAFDYKKNILLKTDAFNGFAKSTISVELAQKELEIFDCKKLKILNIILASSYGLILLIEILFAIFLSITTLNVVLLILNLGVLVSLFIFFIKFTIKNKVGSLKII